MVDTSSHRAAAAGELNCGLGTLERSSCCSSGQTAADIGRSSVPPSATLLGGMDYNADVHFRTPLSTNPGQH